MSGEALIDLVPAGPAADTFQSMWKGLSAGGPMNTAIGLARLAESVQFAGRLSDDLFGRQLQAHLRANGVGLDFAIRTDDPTSLAVVSLGEDRAASYAFHLDGTANFGWQPDELPATTEAQWVHVGSLATVIRPGAAVLMDWADRHPGALSLDINVRPSVIADPHDYWTRVEPWLEVLGARSGVVKASDEDVAFLAEASGVEGTPTRVMAQWWERFGFSVGVVTLGPEGGYAIDDSGADAFVPGRVVEVVDTVGAGDTFMAGFLSEYAATGRLGAALTQGVTAGAYVCARQGPQPPTRAELETFARA